MRFGRITALGVVIALMILCGWLGYRAYQGAEDEQFRTLLVQAAKQGAINLTTIDYEHADADVNRILDSSTGEFHEDFKTRSAPLIAVIKRVKSKTAGTVTEAAIESAGDQDGRVLLAVTVDTTKNGIPDEQPRYWRMRMTLIRTGQDVRVSKMEFVA